MNFTIKPYSSDYAERCADLLQFLWKENAQDRIAHFKWAYTDNPNTGGKPLAVIAINEDDEVVGFRGYHTLSYNFNGQELLLAYFADTVVSPKARRQGIMEKMTSFSFEYLTANNVSCISNLTPSWPPYFGYKKLGFEDVSQFRSRYYISLCNIVKNKICSRQEKSAVLNFKKEREGIRYYVSSQISDDVLAQIPPSSQLGKIESNKNQANLKWKSSHPNAHYVYVYALDSENKLQVFYWLKDGGNAVYQLGMHYAKNMQLAKKAFRYFVKTCRPSFVAAWSFALEDEEQRLLKRLGMVKIPFINKIRKNPPVIVRSLRTSLDGAIDWFVNGLDIREVENWVINKYDGDSF